MGCLCERQALYRFMCLYRPQARKSVHKVPPTLMPYLGRLCELAYITSLSKLAHVVSCT